MPLNKLENFIKNVEGRILYVNPNDLDATDSIENQGNSLTKPFKTIQRAILESARFSYLRGSNNDITEKTTILLFPGEHLIDNRPGFAIKRSNDGSAATAVSPSGAETAAQDTLSLTLTSNFDLTQNDNILYKFNSIYGGVVVPRGTSIVGLDLRKTKIRAKYVPNPTAPEAPNSAIFRITGACYFWQFSIFDADENGLVYTDPRDFSTNSTARPTFSHHKLTCFEYCDGVNIPTGYDITDLDMYYSKLSNAFNLASGRNIDQKYPNSPLGFAKQRPEWEIVGAFATDPINITNIISGDGFTPGPVVTVTTAIPHNLTENTPIKIRGVNVDDYNISTKVQSVPSETSFTYVLPFVRNNLPAGSPFVSASSATVTIETDTVSGASPYIFNISLRSVWGMNGMHADGSKSSGFRSMVVAQFTAVSLQKDDRAFVKYNSVNRTYDGISVSKVTGSLLSSGSSSTNIGTVYHLDPKAIYRQGWQTTHIKISNDAFVQVVSVFAIGFNKHFAAESGGDVSITNSNSNFGQFSLSSDGFKKEAFDKDNKAFITSIVTPKAVVDPEINIDWISLDVNKTQTVGLSSHLYLFGFNNVDVPPPIITQGYRIGARVNDVLYVDTPSGTRTATICMVNNDVSIGSGSTIAFGSDVSEKLYNATGPVNSILTLGSHNILTGEKIRVISESGDLPENLENNVVYYAIRESSTQIKIASSKTNAEASTPINIPIYGGSQLKVVSRVSDKSPGELGSPFQWDNINSGWYIHTNTNNNIFSTIRTLGVAGLTDRTEVSYVKRFDDNRSLDQKLYKLRVVIPKEFTNARDPAEGFIIQESSTTNLRNDADFSLSSITASDFLYNRNPRFISNCSFNVVTSTITVITDLPHNLNVGDQINIKNVSCSNNPSATLNKAYNGTFTVSGVLNNKTFTYSATDVFGVLHTPGTFTNNTNVRNISLPRFERNDIKGNFFIYRSDVITPYQQGVQDGVYYIYLLNSGNQVPIEFTSLKYTQNLVDLYPQLDKDNIDDNPPSAVSFAKRNPLGDVTTNDLKKSITRETVDKFTKSLNIVPTISAVSYTPGTTGTATLTFSREHGLAGVVTHSSLSGGASHIQGTYYNVKLFNEFTLANWDGATAKVVVGASGTVTSVEIIDGGSGYANGETLWIDTAKIGASPGPDKANITITTSGISTAIGNTIQLTGIGTVTDSYCRINSILSRNQVSVAFTSADPRIVVGQYLVHIGPSIQISSSSYNATTQLTTFTCPFPHGLLAGNKFRVLDASNNNMGDFIVDEKISVFAFTAKTSRTLTSPRFILKHALSTNDASADKFGENYGSRSAFFYENENLILSATINNSQTNFGVRLPVGMSGLLPRFPLGTYIQIDNEIMRIVSSTLTGAGNNEITVIRGVMGTIAERHLSDSLIRKVKLIPIEFRRPSIMRASGHTFEYLGYGPGNYSTGLPQIQTTTLTEREEFLSQSQESSCGSVLYSGMNSNGDFFNGNTKTISSSGKVVSYDIPKPTVTGQDPSRLSVIFDEVVVKERLLVEGGSSNTVLSQFDGPVTFNREIKINDILTVNSNTKITDPDDSTTPTTGALVVSGGVGIGKSVNIGGDLDVIGITSIANTRESTTKDNGALVVEGGVGIEKNLNVGGTLNVTGVVTFTNVTQSTTKDNGAIVVEGGVGIERNLNVGGNFSLNGTAVFNSLLDVNGGATIDDIRIGVAADNEIDTSAGNLILDSSSGTVSVDDNLTVTSVGVIRFQNTTTSTSTASGSLVVSGGVGVAENLYVGGLGRITNTTASSSTTTGALVISGGTGIAGNLNVGGNLAITGTTTLTGLLDANGAATIDDIRIGVAADNEIDTSAGNLILDSSGGTVTIDDNLSVTTAGVVRFQNATTSTSSATGALVVSGGVGVAENLNVGGNFVISGTTTFNGLLDANAGATIDDIRIGIAANNEIDTSTGNLILDSSGGTVSVDDNLTVTSVGVIRFQNTTTSTSTSTGALVVSGGVGVAENLYVGGLGRITNTTASSSTTTGALVISGGVGVAENVYTGGFVYAAQNRVLGVGNAYLSSGGDYTHLSNNEWYNGSSWVDAGGPGCLYQQSAQVHTWYTHNGAGVHTQLMSLTGTGLTLNVNSTFGKVSVSDATNASTAVYGSSTASLRVAGGASIAQTLFIGNGARVTAGGLTVTSGGITVSAGGINASGQTVTATTFSGNATTASLATNVVGTAGCVLYQSATNDTATDAGLTYNGSTNVLTAGQYNGRLQYSVTGSGLISGSFNNTGNATFTINGSSSNTANYVVVRDSAGAFQAGACRFTSIGVDVAPPAVGNLSVRLDITAFASDMRLKTNIEPIKNALNKVCSLRGFTYNFNEIAEKIGFESEKRHAGVSAQEIQAVLPEAVAPAPADENYLTVKYEKLVPLLIEAIKELKFEIEELKNNR